MQLAKYYGARVTAVCNTKNLEIVKSLGADEVIDYTKEDFTKSGQTYEVVFDAVGKTSFFRCKNLIKKGGVYFSTDLGFLAQNLFLVLWTGIFGSRKVKFPIPKDRKEDVAFFKELIEAGKYRAVIDRRYPLEQIVEAYRYVETGQKTGNVVITVGPGNSNEPGCEARRPPSLTSRRCRDIVTGKFLSGGTHASKQPAENPIPLADRLPFSGGPMDIRRPSPGEVRVSGFGRQDHNRRPHPDARRR